MRKSLLTDSERKRIRKYLDGKEDRTPVVRNTARYARQINFQEIYADIKLIRAFLKACPKVPPFRAKD